MKSILLLLLFSACSQLHVFGQSDPYSITDISFPEGIVTLQDTAVEVPVMQIKLVLPDVHALGRITFDVMDASGVVLFTKRELLQEEFSAFWSDGLLTVPINFILDQRQSYKVKTTLQTAELSYLPQLITNYPQ